jgi:hypothetical protein
MIGRSLTLAFVLISTASMAQPQDCSWSPHFDKMASIFQPKAREGVGNLTFFGSVDGKLCTLAESQRHVFNSLATLAAASGLWKSGPLTL